MCRKLTFASFIAFVVSGVVVKLFSLQVEYPYTPVIPVVDTVHGVEIIDNFRWLESSDDPEVLEWVKKQNELTRSILDSLPYREYLTERYNELYRYDDVTAPLEVIEGNRIFYWVTKEDLEKWIYCTREDQYAEEVVLLDPNKWEDEVTIHGLSVSRDGKFIAYGKAKGGDENPVVEIMNVETDEILPDTLRGTNQYVNSWLPDNSGFYYTAKPYPGEVPEGEEHYWSAVYFHELGAPADLDEKVFYHDSVKEYYHYASITEDGKYLVFNRSNFYTSEIYYKELFSEDSLIPLVTGFDNYRYELFVEDKILIMTDEDAPMYKVFITDVNSPQRENWKLFLPEREDALLENIHPIDNHIYAVYQQNAYTKIEIYDLEGNYIRDLPLPSIGTAYISGHWSKPTIWVTFASFVYPTTIFKYHFEGDSLELYKESPLEIEVEDYTEQQIWYESRDGTPVSMFLIYRKDLVRDGNNPVLLTGYGGFGLSILPGFSPSLILWLETGGMYAIPNLRGGGEYGESWHESGMLGNKQNVFDDFICAAEWLIENDYTNPEKLAISGGSNGGLLVGAAMVQRPDLFKVIYCQSPLLDMVRYHLFNYANVWKEEYGNSEDPEQFEYLLKYSPYHNVEENIDYPAIIISTGENDPRVDPLHSKKMVALLQTTDPGGNPALLEIRSQSGHGGYNTVTEQINHSVDVRSFLMYYLDMEFPE